MKNVLNSAARLTVGLIFTGIVLVVGMIGLLFLLPWHVRRIRLTNRLGTVLGKGIMRISGSTVRVTGQEHVSESRPAIYAGNHTSIFDAFTSIWLSPLGTVGVAKKEIIYYPFYGVAWLLAGHLTIDRSRSERAKASMRKMGEMVRRKNLHLFILPEGTRSSDGRLLPFKKGIVHLAIQTGLPIVPMVTVGAHHAWEKATLSLRAVPIDIEFLPPVDTSGWSEDRIDEHVAELRQVFIDALPEHQRPQESAELVAA